MKILAVTAYCLNTPHFETELEIIQSHIDKGDEVTLLGCNFSFPSCDVNLKHRRDVCFKCIGRRKAGIKSLSRYVEIKPIIHLTKEDRVDVEELKSRLINENELDQLMIGNFDIGYGILSSLVSAKREPRPDLSQNELSKIASDMLVAATSTYLSIKNYLASGQYDRVYVYNGRYAIMRAVLRACQASDVECFTHEKGGTLDRYALFKNALPHDRKIFQNNLKQSWESAEEDERASVAKAFFEERRNAVDQSWFSFIKEQEEGKLPNTWDDSKRNIVLFNSSEDEFSAIGRQWEEKIYTSQNEGLKRLVSEFIDHPDWHFYLRVHPNLKNINNSQTREINLLDYPNLTVIPAASPISSYALMDKAEKVIVFGSTMGIEATYWGKVAILLGRSFYEGMEVVHEPKTHTEAFEMIRSDLEPKEKERTLPYGYYSKTFGIKFKYYKASGVYTGEFKGQVIRMDTYTRLIAKLDSVLLGWKKSLYTTTGRVGSLNKRKTNHEY